jgi:ferric enterobactin receptor
MLASRSFRLKSSVIAVLALYGPLLLAQEAAPERKTDKQVEKPAAPEPMAKAVEVHARKTAEEVLKQAPGVSIISSEDIEKRPPANDLSEVIRRMPGVNLTGNSATGQRGNNRQIDLRGMGPENTLILIDGKPVLSRTAVRYGKSGERDTRGDSNWVPAEEVDSIEVVRGPAAARYGSGAAGGVVNIITKGIPDKAQGEVTVYANQPESKKEGETRRVNVRVAAPWTDSLGFRLYGNYNKTNMDDPDINVANTTSTSTAAGREGVRNKDLDGLLRWIPIKGQELGFNLGYSRQGNIYAGDTQTAASATSSAGATAASPGANLGLETNVMSRYKYALSHKGDFDFGKTNSYFQYEKTFNSRIDEGLVGGTEGNINSTNWNTARLDSYAFHSDVSTPINLGTRQMLTAGVEWGYQKLDDPASVLNGQIIAGVPGLANNAADRPTTNEQKNVAAFVEDNIPLGEDLVLTPGVRFDRYDSFGNNLSPALNASYSLSSELTLKGGIARVFKAPNLYQTHPGYLIYSSGNGCNKLGTYTVRCYLLGNPDLQPEVSTNKELGINWSNSRGWNAGMTYFRNDYDSKIVAGSNLVAVVSVSGADRYVYRWENATNAIVEGVEGNLLVPLAKHLNWSNNFTYMLRNDDQNGQPLSVIPEFTINTTLDWQYNEKLNLALTGTFYGQQVPRSTVATTGLATSGVENTKLAPYNIWGVSAGYNFSAKYKGRIGISNIFDKQLYREGNSYSAGAASYNEPGRAYYASLTMLF